MSVKNAVNIQVIYHNCTTLTCHVVYVLPSQQQQCYLMRVVQRNRIVFIALDENTNTFLPERKDAF